MPGSVRPQRDYHTDRALFASWVASEDHFGAQQAASRPFESEPRASQHLPPSAAVLQQPPSQERRQATGTLHVTTATPQPAHQEDPAPVASDPPPPPSPEPEPDPPGPPSPGPEVLATSATQAVEVTSRPPPPQPHPQRRRTRDQVVRESYNLLWREYLALTAANEPRRRALAARLDSAASTDIPSPSPATSSIADRRTYPAAPTAAAAAYPPAFGCLRHAMARPQSVPPTSTILQGPLPYDKPKGLGALLLPILCPPTDLLDLQRCTKLVVGVVVRLSAVLVALAFALVPGWLWLVRHELLIGRTCDAEGLAVGGLLLFLLADAVDRAATRIAAARRSGVFTADAKGAYQVAPGRYVQAGPLAGSAAGTKPGDAASTRPGGAAGATATTSRSDGVAATVRDCAGLANGSAAGHGAASTSAVDPMVRQVKQRIIKLERVLFGTELTEADISRDALHSRVQMLCEEVGVPFGGPGGSSARPTVTELEHQLMAVEMALGV